MARYQNFETLLGNLMGEPLFFDGDMLLERIGTPVDIAIQSISTAANFGLIIKRLNALHDGGGVLDRVEAKRIYGLRARGQKTRERLNQQAKDILARVQGDHTKLTDEDRDILMQYSGRGGLQSENSLSEYYTPPEIAEGVWDALKANGFENGNVLEPSTGAGVFLGTKPGGVKVVGAEIDETSSGVAALLNPDDVVRNQSFEQLCAMTPDGTFDSVVGNVPFGDTRGKWKQYDSDYQDIKEMERYFVTRAIDKVKPGGLICLIVPVNIVGDRGKTFQKWRRMLSLKAEFLGAHKLPSGTFGGQNGNGTDTVVDVLVMRKHSREIADKVIDMAAADLEAANVYWNTWIDGEWFRSQEGKRFIHGEVMQGFRGEIVKSELKNAQLKQLLARRFDSRINFEALEVAPTITRNYVDGDRRMIAGVEHELVAGEWVKVEQAVTESGAIDQSKYGLATLDDMRDALAGARSALALTFAQAERAVTGEFADMAERPVRVAVKIAQEAPESMRERVYRAALIGAEIEHYTVMLNTGNAGQRDLERLQELVTAEVSAYGNPANDLAGLVLKGEGANRVAAFATSVQKDGGLNDLLAGKVERGTARAYNGDDLADIVRHLTAMNGKPVALEDVLALYTGPRRVRTLEDAAAFDQVAITVDGLLTTMRRYVSGNVVEKIRDLKGHIARGDESPAIISKWKQQLEAIERARPRADVDAITFAFRGKWYPRRLLEEFLAEQGYTDIEWDERERQWWVEGADGFEKQLGKYINGQGISAGTRTSEYKDRVSQLEEQFNIWMRQHEEIDELVALYNDVFNAHLPHEYDESPLGLDGVSDQVKPHGYQNAAIRRASEEGRGIVALDVGLGKAQPLDAKILTPNGWKLMGDISVGDLVIAADGTAVAVTGVFPQGEKEIFEVAFSDGSKTRCCDEHLWLTQTEKDRKSERYARRNGKERSIPGTVKALSEIRDTLTYQAQRNHKIPLVAPVQHRERQFLIDPYVMGVLIGDGCFRGSAVTFTPGDSEIAAMVAEIVAEQGLPVEVRQRNEAGDRAATWGISRTDGEANVFRSDLQRLGLDGALSQEKFIPNEYLYASIEQRTALLRGLMDTDGYVSKDGITVQFSSASERLASGVRELVQSLGGIAWIGTKVPVYQHNGEKREGLLCHTVSIRMPPEINPFRLPRKADRVKPKSKYLPVRYVDSVTPVGKAQAQCISIDHPSRLYVTDDHIVTHNTFSALALAAYNKQQGRANRTCIVVPKAVLENWYHEAKQFYGNLDGALFVGFTPVRDKDGVIQRAPVLDEEGNPRKNRHTGEVEYRDVLKEDSNQLVFEKMHQIPSTAASLVIMTKERFGEIPMRPETRESYTDKMASKRLLSDAKAKEFMFGEKGPKGSYSEAKRSEKYQEMYAREGGKKKNQFPYFEQMGFDSVIVDEAHEFKNAYEANSQTSKLAYLPTAPASKRSIDMAAKMAYLREHNGGRGPVLLSATPVTNSPTEIFNMLSYVMDIEEFESMGITSVDDFIAHYCDVATVDVVKLSGKVEAKEAVIGFRNLDGLRNLFNRFTNVKKAADVNDDANSLKIPDANEILAGADMLPEQRALYEELRQQAEGIEIIDGQPVQVDPEDRRPIFAIIRDMDRVTTDLDLYFRTMTFTFAAADRAKVDRLVADLPETLSTTIGDADEGEDVEREDVSLASRMRIEQSGNTLTLTVPEGYEDEVVRRLSKFGIVENTVAHPVTPKYSKMLDNLRAEYENGGKQIVFTEEKTQHNKIKRLIVHHLPVTASEIEIINAQTASGDRLEKISAAYNTGKARIVIANRKAEVGVNLQRGTTAIHHLTLPWTPASIQQRNGRGVRQGNTAEKVDVFYYVGKGSFDQYRLDMLKRKADWLDALFTGSESRVENANAGVSDEYAAMLAADPEEFKRRIEAQKAEKAARERDQRNIRAAIDLHQLAAAKRVLAKIEERRAAALEDASDEERDAINERYDAMRRKNERKVKTLTDGLLSQQEGGKIDVDAKTMIESGQYVVDTNGSIIRAGGFYQYERRSTTGKDAIKIILEVTAVDPEARTIKGRLVLGNDYTLEHGLRGDASMAINRLPRGLVEIKINRQQLAQERMMALSFIEYAKLFDNEYRVGAEWLAEMQHEKPGSHGMAVVREASGQYALRMGNREPLPEGISYVYPEPDSAEYRAIVGKLMVPFITADRYDMSGAFYAIMLAEKVFGREWREAVAVYGKQANADEIERIATETTAMLLDTVEAAADGLEQRIAALTKAEAAAEKRAKQAASEAGYSNVVEIAAAAVARITAALDKAQADLRAQREAESAARKERLAKMQAEAAANPDQSKAIEAARNAWTARAGGNMSAEDEAAAVAEMQLIVADAVMQMLQSGKTPAEVIAGAEGVGQRVYGDTKASDLNIGQYELGKQTALVAAVTLYPDIISPAEIVKAIQAHNGAGDYTAKRAMATVIPGLARQLAEVTPATDRAGLTREWGKFTSRLTALWDTRDYSNGLTQYGDFSRKGPRNKAINAILATCQAGFMARFGAGIEQASGDRASVSSAIPESVIAAFASVGIEAKTNEQAVMWAARNKGKQALAEPGTRLFLFDAKGRGGPLNEMAQGWLKREFGAVWSADFAEGFKGLWWHIPVAGTDFEKLESRVKS